MKRLAFTFPVLLLLVACGGPIDFDACDIRDSSCQENIYLAVQRVRGNAWDPWLDMPEMRVISQDEFRAEIQADIDARPDDAPYSHYGASLSLLHLTDPVSTMIEDDRTEATVSNVAAYYDTQTKNVTIIDRGAGTDFEDDTYTLAHELVHAAQDRDVGIQAWARRGTISQSHASSAVIEGEATLYANLATAPIRGFGPLETNWGAYHSRWLDSQRLSVEEAASPWFEMYGLLYPLGSRYLTRAWLSGGNVAVREIYASPPNDIVEFLLPFGTGLGSRIEPSQCSHTAPTGFESEVVTSMGALGFFCFLTRLDVVGATGWAMADDLRNDVYSVYGNDADETVVVWQLWTSTAEGVASEASNLLGPDSVVRDGNQVRIMVTNARVLDWTTWRDPVPGCDQP